MASLYTPGYITILIPFVKNVDIYGKIVESAVERREGVWKVRKNDCKCKCHLSGTFSIFTALHQEIFLPSCSIQLR